MTRAAIYARVSTTDQDNAVQIGELRRYADSRGWEVSEVHQDTISGAKAKRPGLDAILQSAREGRIDVVIVWKMDRFGRGWGHLVNNILELEALGVRFVATTQGIDTDKSNPISQLLMRIMMAFAEFEREMICERTAAGRQAAKQRGVKFGRPKRIFDRDKAILMLDRGASERKVAKALGVSRGAIRANLGFYTLKNRPSLSVETNLEVDSSGVS